MVVTIDCKIAQLCVRVWRGEPVLQVHIQNFAAEQRRQVLRLDIVERPGGLQGLGDESGVHGRK